MSSPALSLTCLCGAVLVETTKRPDFVHECNCLLCSKTGARWGYFHPEEGTVTGQTHSYTRQDKADAGAVVHFCPTCGSTTHFTLTDAMIAKHGNTMLGVNVRLADDADLAGIELRFPDGKTWDGASAFGYVAEARIFGS